MSQDLNELFAVEQIDSALLLSRLDRKNPRSRSRDLRGDEEVRETLLKIAGAYRQEAKTSKVMLDARDERVFAKPQLAQKIGKIFMRLPSAGSEAIFRLSPVFAAQLTKQIQSEQYRRADRVQSQQRRAAREAKR